MKKGMDWIRRNAAGVLASAALAWIGSRLSGFIPNRLISGSVFALLLGMALHPLAVRYSFVEPGAGFVSKRLLRLSIVLMGLTLRFSQVLSVGKFSLMVMCFTLLTAFGGGYLLGKLLGMDWKLSGLISAGTGICGGSAIAAISPVIDAGDTDVAYAISATFLFDILMVVLFPILGRAWGMTDMGYGLWAGTAVNDTSSVVAAGYAFSDAAGAYSVIVKLTRTLSILPAVLIFSFIRERERQKESQGMQAGSRKRVNLGRVFPVFIVAFLCMVVLRSVGVVPPLIGDHVASVSKYCMAMALGAIGLKTDFRKMMRSGAKPMLHGFLISALVVVVSFFAQAMLGQL